jgi:hypothetical protein
MEFRVAVAGYVDGVEFAVWVKVADLMLKHFATIEAEIGVCVYVYVCLHVSRYGKTRPLPC